MMMTQHRTAIGRNPDKSFPFKTLNMSTCYRLWTDGYRSCFTKDAPEQIVR